MEKKDIDRSAYVGFDDDKKPIDKHGEEFERERNARKKRVAERNKKYEETAAAKGTPKAISKKGLEEFKKKLEKKTENLNFINPKIKRVLRDKPALRDTFLALVRVNPARFHEIELLVFDARRTTYNLLHKLRGLGLVIIIPVMDIWNKRKLDDEQKEVMKKVKIWFKNMEEGMKRYFAGKTGYWALTELGRSEDILEWALKQELEMKGYGDSEK